MIKTKDPITEKTSQPSILCEITEKRNVMNIEDSIQVLQNYCLQEMTETGKTWLAKRVAELSQGLDQDVQNQIVEEMLRNLEDDITHHAEKVMENGFNEGRLSARCRFLIEQWDLDCRVEVDAAIRDCIEKIGGLGAYIGPKDDEDEDEEQIEIPPTPDEKERVFLAQQRGISNVVLAIVTNEGSAFAAQHVAEVIAKENDATILAWRVIRA
jgi:hypothetical protein